MSEENKNNNTLSDEELEQASGGGSGGFTTCPYCGEINNPLDEYCRKLCCNKCGEKYNITTRKCPNGHSMPGGVYCF